MKNDKTVITKGSEFARKVGRTMDIARSKSISHFAPKPPVVTPVTPRSDVRPDRHPLVISAEKRRVAKLSGVKRDIGKPVKPAEPVEQEVLSTVFQAAAAENEQKKASNKRKRKIFQISFVSLALILAVGYVVYLFMPGFSVRVASAQAGIDATYPEYSPDGYSLDGPVSYSDGQVTINFRANTGDKKFAIKQTKSSWDSTAVKDKMVRDSGGEISTTSERGLTIYTYDSNAAWVNGGILYSINGNAPLSSDQIRRIATSL